MPRAEGVADNPAGYLVLGRIVGVFGVRGWVKVRSETSPRDNIMSYPYWYLRGREGWYRKVLRNGRPQGKTLVASLQGVENRDAALALVGQEIGITRDMLPATEPGEYYWADLVGCSVVLADGTALGTVARLFETGANDVLVVSDERESKSTAREVLIPWVCPEVITHVDVVEHRISVDWDPDF